VGKKGEPLACKSRVSGKCPLQVSGLASVQKSISKQVAGPAAPHPARTTLHNLVNQPHRREQPSAREATSPPPITHDSFINQSPAKLLDTGTSPSRPAQPTLGKEERPPIEPLSSASGSCLNMIPPHAAAELLYMQPKKKPVVPDVVCTTSHYAKLLMLCTAQNP